MMLGSDYVPDGWVDVPLGRLEQYHGTSTSHTVWMSFMLLGTVGDQGASLICGRAVSRSHDCGYLHP
jgi:hypothetical protein